MYTALRLLTLMMSGQFRTAAIEMLPRASFFAATLPPKQTRFSNNDRWPFNNEVEVGVERNLIKLRNNNEGRW